MSKKSTKTAKTNILLKPWTGPYGGTPPFDKVKVKDLKPAVFEAIAEYKKEIKAIAKNKEKPNFENTIKALEKSGELLKRVMPIFSVWSGSIRGAEFEKIEAPMALKLAALEDEINQNAELFKRVEAVYNSPDKKDLTPEEQRLVWLRYNNFVLQGARLNAAKKAKVSKINQRIAALTTKFNQNVMADEESQILIVSDIKDLDGLSPALIESAAAEAKRRKLKNKWVISNARSIMEPFLTTAKNRSLREKAFRLWVGRGDNGNKNDNNKIALESLKLRAERSKLFGYPTFAHWKLADKMAKDPDRAMELMLKVWKPAVEAARKEIADMQQIADKENAGIKIQPWDYRFYAEKVRQARYDFNEDELRPFLQLDKIRDAMFWCAEELYGFKFSPIQNIPVFHKDVRVYEVKSGSKPVGLFYFDPFARSGKSSGAWMDSYRAQHRLDGTEVLPLVSNNSNFIPAKPGDPVLISWGDAITMFHEFGHALHGLSSKVTYPSLSGTNTTGDFVELPSQMHEKFLPTNEVLKFLTNKEGQALPKALIKKMDASKTFNEGFATVEFLAAAIVDMKLHLAGSKLKKMSEFEKEILQEIGMPEEIVMRHRIPHFSHIFSGEGYAAGYYGYLWAQVLDHDAFSAFVESGNAFNKKVAKSFFDNILSVGNTVDPDQAFEKFRGRPAEVKALLRSRGFPEA